MILYGFRKAQVSKKHSPRLAELGEALVACEGHDVRGIVLVVQPVTHAPPEGMRLNALEALQSHVIHKLLHCLFHLQVGYADVDYQRTGRGIGRHAATYSFFF